MYRKIRPFKSVSIIALGNDHHWIALDNLCHLLSEFHVKIYTTIEYVKELNRLGCKYYLKHELEIKEDSESKSNFLTRIRSEIEKSDVIMLETLRTEFEWFAKNRLNIPVILFVHCLNWWAFPKKRWPLFRILRNIKGIRSKLTVFNLIPSIKGENVANRQRVLMNVDALVFHDPGMVDYYYSNWSPPFHQIAVMPYTYYDPDVILTIKNHGSDNNKGVTKTIRFIVPGSIYQSRRNYDLILVSFEEASKQTQVKIELIFPGPLLRYESNYGLTLKKRFDRINSSNSNLMIHYNSGRETTSTDEYNGYMQSSDVIVSQMPLNGKKMFKYYDEQYCESTACHYADLARFCKPGIFPGSFKMIPELAPIVDIYYTESELIEIILKYTNRDFLMNRKSKAERLSRKYFSKESIMKLFLKQILSEQVNRIETTKHIVGTE